MSIRQYFVTAGIAMTTAVASAVAIAGPAQAAAGNYGGSCNVFPDNAAATIDSLRFSCSFEQHAAIYASASAGSVPTGVRNGWVVSPPGMIGVAAAVGWAGKTFFTGPGGGRLVNRIFGGEAFPADIYYGPSVAGGGAWVLNYSPSGLPQLVDEVREIAPGVWLGPSMWNGATTLFFVVA